MSTPSVSTVIGSGTMGPGIAATLARRGSQVRINDISREVLDAAEGGYALAEKVLDRLDTPVAPGGATTFELELSTALADTELVIEAVPEMLELKQQVLAQVEDVVGDDVVIATNTSGIPITKLADGMRHPERLIGMHWSNPPHLIPMIEIVRGDETSDDVQDRLVGIVEGFGYEAVIEREVPGFVENRVLYAIMRECLAMLEEGIATQEDIDTCVKWGIGYKLSVVGPMRLLDMAGLDIYESVAGYLNKDLSDTQGVPSVVTERTRAGNLGMKTGSGMYEYGEGDVAAKRADIVNGLIEARRTLSGIERV